MSQKKQANPSPQTKNNLPHMVMIKKTPMREVTKKLKRPSRKAMKTLKMRKPVKKSWKKVWKKRKKGKPRNSTRKQKKRGKLRMRKWKRPVLWKRGRRRGPEGSQGSRRILRKPRKKKKMMMKRVPKMKRRARKRSKMRPKKTEKKSRRMSNRRKNRKSRMKKVLLAPRMIITMKAQGARRKSRERLVEESVRMSTRLFALIILHVRNEAR
jgi:hypothetical protein